MSTGDYIEIEGRQDEGSTRTLASHLTAVRLPTGNCWVGNSIDSVSLTSGVYADLSFPTRAFVGGSGWSWSSSTLTIPSTGNYLIIARWDIDDSADGKLATDVLVNGASLGRQERVDEGSGQFFTLRSLTAGDDITWKARSDTTGNTEIASGLTVVEITGACVNAAATGSSQTIPNGSFSAIAYGAEYVDTNGFHDNVTNNTRITIPSSLGGNYLVMAKAEITCVDDTQMELRNNGSAVITWRTINRNAYTGVSGVVALSVSDYIETAAETDLGGGGAIVSTTYAPEFIAIRIDDFSYPDVSWTKVIDCPWTSLPGAGRMIRWYPTIGV